MNTESGFDADWLALREPADAAARSVGLLEPLRAGLRPGPLVIRDLGCGTGSMARWLAGRLSAPQHWVLQDRDPELLAIAHAGMPSTVTAETARGDVTDLTAADLAGTSLVTASALIDLLTEPQLDRIAAACIEAGCPALFTMTVAGIVRFNPADRLDQDLESAFNAHQQRDGKLGPDAPAIACTVFHNRNVDMHVRPSFWRLDEDDAALEHAWLRGWVAAAVEQEPDLASEVDEYLEWRLEDGFRVDVGHLDLLGLP